MRKSKIFLGVALLSTGIFTACEPKEPSGNGNNNNNNNNTSTTDVGVVINGVTWATRNVDKPNTFAAKPESTGCFYQWNRPTAWAATGDVTGWNNTYPEGTTWATANDPCPAGWRVPTRAEIESLLNSRSLKR